MTEASKRPATKTGDDRPTVLLVGRGEAMQDAVAVALERHAIAVERSDTARAVEAVFVSAPDLVVLLGDAAEDEGSAVLSKLAANVATAVIPVALLTDDTKLDDRLRAFRFGAVAIVERSASADAMARRIAELAREVPERDAEVSGELGEASIDEVVDLFSKRLRSGILAVTALGGGSATSAKVVLRGDRPVTQAIEEFVDRIRPLVSKSDSEIRIEFQESPTGKLRELDEDDSSHQADLGILFRDRRIVIVERSPTRADELVQSLRNRGAHVVVIDGDGLGLTRARAIDPDVIVVDVDGLTGWASEVMRTIRRDPRLRWASVLLVRASEIWPEGAPEPDVARLGAGLLPLIEPDVAIASRVADATKPLELRLESMGPARMLRALARTGKTLHLTVRHARATIEIDLAEGLLVGARGRVAEADALAGASALAALLALGSGRVRVEARDAPSVANVMAPIDDALAAADREVPPLRPSLPPPSLPPPEGVAEAGIASSASGSTPAGGVSRGADPAELVRQLEGLLDRIRSALPEKSSEAGPIREAIPAPPERPAAPPPSRAARTMFGIAPNVRVPSPAASMPRPGAVASAPGPIRPSPSARLPAGPTHEGAPAAQADSNTSASQPASSIRSGTSAGVSPSESVQASADAGPVAMRVAGSLPSAPGPSARGPSAPGPSVEAAPASVAPAPAASHSVLAPPPPAGSHSVVAPAAPAASHSVLAPAAPAASHSVLAPPPPAGSHSVLAPAAPAASHSVLAPPPPAGSHSVVAPPAAAASHSVLAPPPPAGSHSVVAPAAPAASHAVLAAPPAGSHSVVAPVAAGSHSVLAAPPPAGSHSVVAPVTAGSHSVLAAPPPAGSLSVPAPVPPAASHSVLAHAPPATALEPEAARSSSSSPAGAAAPPGVALAAPAPVAARKKTLMGAPIPLPPRPAPALANVHEEPTARVEVESLPVAQSRATSEAAGLGERDALSQQHAVVQPVVPVPAPRTAVEISVPSFWVPPDRPAAATLAEAPAQPADSISSEPAPARVGSASIADEEVRSAALPRRSPIGILVAIVALITVAITGAAGFYAWRWVAARSAAEGAAATVAPPITVAPPAIMPARIDGGAPSRAGAVVASPQDTAAPLEPAPTPPGSLGSGPAAGDGSALAARGLGAAQETDVEAPDPNEESPLEAEAAAERQAEALAQAPADETERAAPRSRRAEIDHLIRRANFRRARGELQAAEGDYLRVLRLQSTNPRAMAGLTRLHMARRDPRAATQWARRLVNARPTQPGNHVLLGDVLQMAGDREGARRAWRRALELNPGDRDARRRLGR